LNAALEIEGKEETPLSFTVGKEGKA